MKITKTVSVLSLILIFAFVFSNASHARFVRFERPQVLQGATEAAEKREKAQEHLQEVKENVCEKRQAVIKRRSANLVSRSAHIINKVESIVDRVETFYIEKLIPQGKTVENYDQLLANIAGKKAAVSEKLALAEATIKDFDCNISDPKAQLQAFNQAMREVIASFKDYKKAVIEFIRTIHAAASEVEATPSASTE